MKDSKIGFFWRYNTPLDRESVNGLGIELIDNLKGKKWEQID